MSYIQLRQFQFKGIPPVQQHSPCPAKGEHVMYLADIVEQEAIRLFSRKGAPAFQSRNRRERRLRRY
nr:hypothetical protein CFP56_24660 [Quercus suber]